MTTKQCKRCGDSFETSNHRVKYCGDTCSEMAVVERVQANHSKTGKALVKLMPQRPPKQGNAEWVRAREYDEGYGEKFQSVYSPLAIIAIERNVSECKSCHCVKPLVNGYCEPCIVLGGNEKQVMKPTEIQARSRAGRENSAQSPWRFGIGKR